MELQIKGSEFTIKALKRFIVDRQDEIIPIIEEVYGIDAVLARQSVKDLTYKIIA